MGWLSNLRAEIEGNISFFASRGYFSLCILVKKGRQASVEKVIMAFPWDSAQSVFEKPHLYHK